METPSLDRKKLIGVIAEKLNVLISEDDPVFATVVLNELVLSQFINVAHENLDALVFQIQRLKSSIPVATDEAAAKMQIQAEKILKSVDLLTNEVKEMDSLRVKNIEAAAKSSAEFAMVDVYKSVNEIMTPVIERVTKGMEQSLNNLNESYNGIQTLHSRTAISVVNSVNKAIRKMNNERNKTIFYCAFSSAIGSGVACGIAIAILQSIK